VRSAAPTQADRSCGWTSPEQCRKRNGYDVHWHRSQLLSCSDSRVVPFGPPGDGTLCGRVARLLRKSPVRLEPDRGPLVPLVVGVVRSGQLPAGPAAECRTSDPRSRASPRGAPTVCGLGLQVRAAPQVHAYSPRPRQRPRGVHRGPPNRRGWLGRADQRTWSSATSPPPDRTSVWVTDIHLPGRPRPSLGRPRS